MMVSWSTNWLINKLLRLRLLIFLVFNTVSGRVWGKNKQTKKKTKLLWAPAVSRGSSSHSSNNCVSFVASGLECCTCGWESGVLLGVLGVDGISRKDSEKLDKESRLRCCCGLSGSLEEGRRRRQTKALSLCSPRQRSLWPDAINHSHDTNRSRRKREEMLHSAGRVRRKRRMKLPERLCAH